MATEAAKARMEHLTAMDRTERLVYRPRTGRARPIQATVTRGSPAPMIGTARAPRFAILVLNDASDGIAAAALDVGADRIDVAETIGGEAMPRGIQKIAKQSPDWLVLEAQ